MIVIIVIRHCFYLVDDELWMSWINWALDDWAFSSFIVALEIYLTEPAVVMD